MELDKELTNFAKLVARIEAVVVGFVEIQSSRGAAAAIIIFLASRLVAASSLTPLGAFQIPRPTLGTYLIGQVFLHVHH